MDTLNYSRAAKRKHKKRETARDMYAKLDEVQRMMDVPEQDSPQETVIAARARRMGLKPGPKMLEPMLCFEAGRAIDIGSTSLDEARKLWTVFAALDSAEGVYFLRIIGRPRFPNVAKMEYLPSTTETRDDDRPDTRSDDEKDRDAANGWMRWQGYLGHLRGFERETITRALWQMDELHKGPDLTVTGESFVRAMRLLAEIVETAR